MDKGIAPLIAAIAIFIGSPAALRCFHQEVRKAAIMVVKKKKPSLEKLTQKLTGKSFSQF